MPYDFCWFTDRTLLLSDWSVIRVKGDTEVQTPSLPAAPALCKPTSVHGWRVTHPAGSAKLEKAWCLICIPLNVKCGVFPSGGDRSKHKGRPSEGNLFAWIGCGHGATGSVPGAVAFRWPWAESGGHGQRYAAGGRAGLFGLMLQDATCSISKGSLRRFSVCKFRCLEAWSNIQSNGASVLVNVQNNSFFDFPDICPRSVG